MTESARDRAPAARVGGAGPVRVAIVVALVGAVITFAVSWSAWLTDRQNERNLLRVQTAQAASVITSTILGIKDPLAAALQIEQATGGDVAQFARSLGPLTGPGRTFAASALYDVTESAPRVVTSSGSAPELAPGSTLDLVRRAVRAETFVVNGVGVDQITRVAYAIADRADPRFVVYAERAIPPNRVATIETDPAFENLAFATYLGPGVGPERLATTNVPPDRLPLGGDTAQETIPFGDTTLTLVASARVPLGGPIGGRLPYVLLAGGGLITAAATAVAARFVRRRRDAERDAQTISGLFAEVDALYAEQRTIAEALQHALLPRTNPDVPGLQIASRYVAGARGIDIGGDWYSVVVVDDRHVAFVVGDVSGRGISAATVMARLRFTMRAYLLEGHSPAVVLGMCATQLDIVEDGHFATVLVGLVDLETHGVVLANAGHLEPLLISEGRARPVATDVGLPLGIVPGPYTPTECTLEPGTVLLAFTDGLVERRGESIDDGLQRLQRSATLPPGDLDAYLTDLVGRLTMDGSEDDVAILALRFEGTPALDLDPDAVPEAVPEPAALPAAEPAAPPVPDADVTRV